MKIWIYMQLKFVQSHIFQGQWYSQDIKYKAIYPFKCIGWFQMYKLWGIWKVRQKKKKKKLWNIFVSFESISITQHPQHIGTLIVLLTRHGGGGRIESYNIYWYHGYRCLNWYACHIVLHVGTANSSVVQLLLGVLAYDLWCRSNKWKINQLV